MGGACGNFARRMMPSRAVSEDTMKRARSFAVIRGPAELRKGTAMDDILATFNLDNYRAIHIATLSAATVDDAGASHLGYDGYFVFETCDAPGAKGTLVHGKAASLESAFRLIDLWAIREAVAA